MLFPQHEPGKKHERSIVLADWQQQLVELNSEHLVKGLIESDGWQHPLQAAGAVDRLQRVAKGVKVREGYELWHPNREKAEAKTTKAIVAFVLLISAALLVIITLGGWERLQSPGVGLMTLIWAGLYVLFAFLVLRWNRGLLPVASAMAILMVIFAAVAADGWFARAKDGLDDPALPPDLLGVLTIVVIPVSLLLIAVAMVGFNQAWNVEEERPIGSAGRTSGGTPPPPAAPERDNPPARPPAETEVDEDPPPAGQGPAYAKRDDDGWDDGAVSPAI